MANYFKNFTLFDATPSEACSDSYESGLQQTSNELGCCVDAVYNNMLQHAFRESIVVRG